jgi:hypothetical protein
MPKQMQAQIRELAAIILLNQAIAPAHWRSNMFGNWKRVLLP